MKYRAGKKSYIENSKMHIMLAEVGTLANNNNNNNNNNT
jgi:hypothetical protein